MDGTDRAAFGPIIPILGVTDAAASAAFYCDVLGFEKLWEHRFGPGFPLYVGVRRGPIELHLNEHDDSGHRAELYVPVDDVDRAFRELTGRGLEPEGPPEDQAHGVRSFAFTDPDGHRLTLGTDLPGFAATRTG